MRSKQCLAKLKLGRGNYCRRMSIGLFCVYHIDYEDRLRREKIKIGREIGRIERLRLSHGN
jgi:hypothetical protein